VALTALLLAAAPDATVVQRGEDLPAVAKRALGDAAAAPELRALNALESDRPEPGTVIKLPGPDRDLAVRALAAARNAVQQASKASNAPEARAQLEQAESLFQAARYRESAKAADSAWQQLASSEPSGSRFAVEVADNGTTQVTTRAGMPVRVDAEGVIRTVAAGQRVKVTKGAAPSAPVSALNAPAPLKPEMDDVLRFKPHDQGLGPVKLSWAAVEGARGYEVEVTAVGQEQQRVALQVERPQAVLPRMPEGKYRWTVRARAEDGSRSESSEARVFELQLDPLKLEVKTKWK
jgi:hypothetical protein